MPASAERRRGARARALLGAALIAVVAVSCSSEPPDPAEVRRQQVRDRLEATFSDAQAECIVDALDDAAVRALVRTSDLAADDEAFRQYSNVVLLCARGTTSTSTSTAPATTTTGDDATTTGG
ncbi:MAG: hypothetical protein KDB04_15870 [Acidimicrobiales bacterium]|nr:hypothetical protein [Acidimicrobiales bacterium]